MKSRGRLGVFAAGILFSGVALGCAPAIDAPAPDCSGGKCDDPRGLPTAHGTAVLACDRARDEGVGASDSAAAERTAQQKFRTCLATANDSAHLAIEENLVVRGAPERTLEEIAIVFDEFRYASLCVDLQAASTLEGDALELLAAKCEAVRERTLAELVGALVDFGAEGTGWSLEINSESFAGCYESFESDLEGAGSPAAAYVARQELVACAAKELAALAVPLKNAYCAQNSCTDEPVVLSFIEAGFETAIATSDRACGMLVDASGVPSSESGRELLDCRMLAYSELFQNVALVLPE